MSTNTIVAAGQFTATLTHPLYNSGAATTIEGYKLEGQMVQAQQAMDSSKVVALANGNTITITNNNGAGTLTFNVTRTNGTGDMVKIANFLKDKGDSVGGTISISQSINGATDTQVFYGCTVKTCPPLIVQGNDASDYSVVWNYASTANTTSTTEDSSAS